MFPSLIKHWWYIDRNHQILLTNFTNLKGGLNEIIDQEEMIAMIEAHRNDWFWENDQSRVIDPKETTPPQ